MNCRKRALINADSVRVVSEKSFELGSSKPTTTSPFVRCDLKFKFKFKRCRVEQIR